MPHPELILAVKAAPVRGALLAADIASAEGHDHPYDGVWQAISEHQIWKPRDELEVDPVYKQLIPYCVVTHYERDYTRPCIYSYARTESGGETRLHNKRSVGVGGHIEKVDDNYWDVKRTIAAAARREFAEELRTSLPDSSWRPVPTGFINDDSNDVGRVHLGILVECNLPLPTVRPNEDSLTDAWFETIEALLTELDRYETWSQIVLKRYARIK